MRPLPLILLGMTATLSAADASAQVGYNAPRAGGGLGGGFVELLMTGRDPSRAHAAWRSQAAPAGRPAGRQAVPTDPYWDADPFAEPSGRGRARVAALPIDPPEGLLERAPRSEYRRREVAYDGPEAPGTIVVDTPGKFLYHVLPGGRAMRYGIGVGRPGFEWAGMKSVSMKKEWPDWRPPPEMLKRRPDLPRFMQGGEANPLGARALYLGSSLYRIHGTNEPHTIGQNVSSGCIRMMNDDVIHLYDRVSVGTRVKVI
jgi:lipoprotein-anchoring transpeptidase ErfK/SrfK